MRYLGCRAEVMSMRNNSLCLVRLLSVKCIVILKRKETPESVTVLCFLSKRRLSQPYHVSLFLMLQARSLFAAALPCCCPAGLL